MLQPRQGNLVFRRARPPLDLYQPLARPATKQQAFIPSESDQPTIGWAVPFLSAARDVPW